MAKLDPKEMSFKQILTQDKMYKVPMYQRNYSWNEDNWEELWEDILVITDSNESHYMGPIVLKKPSEDVPSTDSFIEIIDGQQRFCTITLIIIASIKVIEKMVENKVSVDENMELIKELKEKYIGSKGILSPKRKLFLNKYNDTFFSINVIDGEKPTDKKNNEQLYGAFEYFIGKLEAFYKGKSGKKIAEFIDHFLTEKLSFIVIYVNNDINAYTIFETLNARGLELSNTDLIKNYLFSLVCKDTSSLRYVEQRWDKIVNKIGYKNLPSFMRYFWISKYKFIRNPYLFKALKENIKKPENVKKLLQDLENNADIYVALSDYDNTIWNSFPNARQYIEELKILSNDVFKILSLAVYDKLEKDIDKALQVCSVIAMRNFISGKNPNEFEVLYSKIALKIQKKEITNILQIKNEIKESYIKDEAFNDYFKNKSIKYTSNKTKIKHILLKFESDLSGKPIANSNKLSIEHILPENPTDGWKEKFNKEEDNYIERIGNYTLMNIGENKKCDRLPFNDKKKTYKSSAFEMTKVIGELPDWDIQRLEQRQQELASRAKHLWRIDFSS